MPSISQQSLRPEAVTDRSAATMAVVGVGNPKERRPEYLCALEALRLHTQNAAAREIISPRHSAGNRKVIPTEQTQLYVAGFANRRAACTPADSSGVFRPNSESMRRGSKLRFANFSCAVGTHHVLFALNHLECAHLHRIILFAECCAPCVHQTACAKRATALLALHVRSNLPQVAPRVLHHGPPVAIRLIGRALKCFCSRFDCSPISLIHIFP